MGYRCDKAPRCYKGKLEKFIHLAILCLISWIIFLTDAYCEAPKVILSEQVHDFGKAWRGSPVTHIFKVKNTGDAELKIGKQETSDSFTSVKMKESISPGKEDEIAVTIDTSELRGPVETTAVLQTNDPSNRLIELKLHGVVVPLIDVKPLSALFFSLYEGQTKEGAVTIVNNGDRPIRMMGTESGSRRFVVHLETITEGREYRLLVKVEPKAEPGRTKEKVILFTDDARAPRVNVGVNIFIKKDVYYFPDEIDFGAISMKKLKENPDMLPFLTQAVLVKRREGKGTDFQVRIENDIPFIEIKKEPDSGSETYRLDVSLVPEKMIPGKIDTFIKVITNDKEVPELKIPVTGEIK